MKSLCLIDPIDHDLLALSWHTTNTGYIQHSALAYKNGKKGCQTSKMHRVVMARIVGRPLTLDDLVDHINGDKADNRRSNLRLASKHLNGLNRHRLNKNNTSGHTRVRQDPGGRWYVRTRFDGKWKRHGTHATKEEAHEAYQRLRSAEMCRRTVEDARNEWDKARAKAAAL